ncbi:MAG: tRNA dihydrouridine synthase DusB [Clostridia bacterium]|nr:tRNA dihydrouridine synthase DusB [Clostridia bacterium]
MKIGNLTLDSCSAFLAPMAGVADRAFREVCTDFGAAYTVSEMVSSKGIAMRDRKSTELLFLSENERPAAVQLFGDNPEIMAQAAKISLEYSPDIIDINMGCPAPKIAGNGGGSALMKNPALAGQIIKSVAEAVNIPVTVKIRTGWDENSLNAVEMAQTAEAAGAAAITVHGRTKKQMYAPPVDLKTIAAIKKAVSIPVIGNGDITDGTSAARMLEETNCDGIMIGRGALGRPWVFSEVSAYLTHGVILPPPPMAQRMLVMIKHIEKLCEYKGDRRGILEARKHAAWYIRDVRDAAKFRKEIFAVEDLDSLKEIAYRISRL